MTVRDLCEELYSRNPEAEVVFRSGYDYERVSIGECVKVEMFPDGDLYEYEDYLSKGSTLVEVLVLK